MEMGTELIRRWWDGTRFLNLMFLSLTRYSSIEKEPLLTRFVNSVVYIEFARPFLFPSIQTWMVIIYLEMNSRIASTY